jgi:hypothetical protein
VLPHYPWYAIVGGTDEVQQGDILRRCPLFFPKSVTLDDPKSRNEFTWEERDVIVMSQSCDLVKGKGVDADKEVLLCVLLKPSELGNSPLATKEGLNELRSGKRPPFHLIAEIDETGFESEVGIISFQHLRCLPLPFVRQRVQHQLHPRLLPPYREHMSQAFARYFMRVGLPVDIPQFR